MLLPIFWQPNWPFLKFWIESTSSICVSFGMYFTFWPPRWLLLLQDNGSSLSLDLTESLLIHTLLATCCRNVHVVHMMHIMGNVTRYYVVEVSTPRFIPVMNYLTFSVSLVLLKRSRMDVYFPSFFSCLMTSFVLEWWACHGSGPCFLPRLFLIGRQHELSSNYLSLYGFFWNDWLIHWQSCTALAELESFFHVRWTLRALQCRRSLSYFMRFYVFYL